MTYGTYLNKKDVLNTLNRAIISYDINLKNKNLMFVYENSNSTFIDDSIDKIETIFLKHNFYHLTGIKYLPLKEENLSKYQVAMQFYNKLLKNKISLDSFIIENEFITSLKIECLYYLNDIEKSVKALGDYDSAKKEKLVTEKLIGNVKFCFGFVKDQKTGFYVPNTALIEDIKKIALNNYKVCCILKKESKEKYYNTITYIKNDFNLNKLLLNYNIAKLLDIPNLHYSNNNDIHNIEKINTFKNNLTSSLKTIQIQNTEESLNVTEEEKTEEDEL